MPKVKTYHLKPTRHIPNSHLPVLHYPSQFESAGIAASEIYDILERNGWTVHWIYRYGTTQEAHYHSTAHECMTVLSGQATIRLGAGDTSPDLEESTNGRGFEDGGVEIQVAAGDTLVIPAGVSHKTYDTIPAAKFALLTPGHGAGIEADDRREAVASVELSGFAMLGAYPVGSHWDFQTGAVPSQTSWSAIWEIPVPDNDPVLGKSSAGLCGLWSS